MCVDGIMCVDGMCVLMTLCLLMASCTYIFCVDVMNKCSPVLR